MRCHQDSDWLTIPVSAVWTILIGSAQNEACFDLVYVRQEADFKNLTFIDILIIVLQLAGVILQDIE